ncbi:TetR-like C-terminal domain-containing protein [Nocardia sp. NPDC057353]|uniref:TetR-like C-terminal domain-containing protein n=1 Tax=Nocardia sp. NPDC057353 TaxID=3346104 RepID=UPI003629458E
MASALYRYFPSRDALLTALIVDAYRDLRDAAAAVPADRPRAQWLAVWRAVRAWALAHPAEFGLLYGTPVPGYTAPPETVEPAAAVLLQLAGIVRAHGTPPAGGAPLPGAVRADLRALIEQQPEGMPEEQLELVMLAWTQLFGAVGFEVFGRLNDLVLARAEYFDRHAELAADLVGLPR